MIKAAYIEETVFEIPINSSKLMIFICIIHIILNDKHKRLKFKTKLDLVLFQ